jgi:large subunit ribosomal protein L24
MKLKKGDKVVVITGKDKGKKSEIIQSFPKKLSLLVKDVNVVKKHQKPTQNKEGGIENKEMLINVSNVAFLDPKMDVPTKIGYKVENGKKVRFAKKSGVVID